MYVCMYVWTCCTASVGTRRMPHGASEKARKRQRNPAFHSNTYSAQNPAYRFASTSPDSTHHVAYLAPGLPYLPAHPSIHTYHTTPTKPIHPCPSPGQCPYIHPYIHPYIPTASRLPYLHPPKPHTAAARFPPSPSSAPRPSPSPAPFSPRRSMPSNGSQQQAASGSTHGGVIGWRLAASSLARRPQYGLHLALGLEGWRGHSTRDWAGWPGRCFALTYVHTYIHASQQRGKQESWKCVLGCNGQASERAGKRQTCSLR